MAVKTITIPLETYKCLRGHLQMANELFASLVVVEESVSNGKTPKPQLKETRSQKIDKYKALIGSGQRAKKPEHLKK